MKIRAGNPITYWESDISAKMSHLAKKQGCKGHGAASDARWAAVALNNEKIRETGGPLALDGHHLAIPHNNQIIAGVSGVEGI